MELSPRFMVYNYRSAPIAGLVFNHRLALRWLVVKNQWRCCYVDLSSGCWSVCTIQQATASKTPILQKHSYWVIRMSLCFPLDLSGHSPPCHSTLPTCPKASNSSDKLGDGIHRLEATGPLFGQEPVPTLAWIRSGYYRISLTRLRRLDACYELSGRFNNANVMVKLLQPTKMVTTCLGNIINVKTNCARWSCTKQPSKLG